MTQHTFKNPILGIFVHNMALCQSIASGLSSTELWMVKS